MKRFLFVIVCLLIVTIGPLASQERFTVMRVIDGDTLIIGEPCSRFDAKTLMRVRLWGIDTPESRRPTAKCSAEVEMGKKATLLARSILKPGDQVDVTFKAQDKYACRIVGSITLPDGRDMADLMILSGFARPYGRDGSLTKSRWCMPRQVKPEQTLHAP